MTPDLWVPGVLILALGAAAGWWLTRRKSGSGAAGSDSAPTESPLEIEDLRHRRDELYARLRASDLDPAERRSLEIEGAQILRKLDEKEVAESEMNPSDPDEEAADEERPAAQPHSTVRTLLTGFLFGGVSVALIALLVFWAGRDATEKEAMPPAEQPHPVGELPAEIASEVGQLLQHLESEPDDLSARKRLALLYLTTDQYVPAFEQAEAVLAVTPDDIDALYVQGVVRMTMGQDDAALVQLNRVLELFPDHVRAMTVKGLIFARRGVLDQAGALWDQALEIGGPQPQIENLLLMLASEAGELPPGHPETGPSAEPGTGEAPAGVTAAGEYRVRVEAEVIPGFPQTGTLFVALRTAGGGPPVAVKRIDRPSFPMLVSLGPQDLMIATGEAELPESGVLKVRLDQDGSASTRGDNDLEGSAEVSRGTLVTVFLD